MGSVVYQRGFVADIDGKALEGGRLYIGTANMDPEVSPISVYWDSALTVPATQPLTISGGYVVNAGARAAVYVASASYSYRVRNAALVQVDYVADTAQGAVTSVAGSGGATGLTVTVSPSTGPVSFTLGGTLALASGGTGAATASGARTNLGLGSIATFAEATTAEYRSNTAGRALSTDKVAAAAGWVTLTDAATVTLDMATFINGTVTLGGNRTLGNPTNTVDGRCGKIEVKQDATGSRTLAYSANWKFAGGTAPILTTTANAKDVLYYEIRSSTEIWGALVKDVK